MITIKEVLQRSKAFLQEKGVVHPGRQAEEIIADCLGMPRLELYLQFDRPLQQDELNQCREVLFRRSKGEPSQYIRGYVEFLNCRFAVDSRVLIPRQETEILVDQIIKELEVHDLKDKELWDICTGSGCIGISLKKRFPELAVSLSDLSADAVGAAKDNSEQNHVQVELLEGDLLNPFYLRKAHFVVCNPPYIAEEEYKGLSKEVKDYEPYSALVSGKTGLEFYHLLNRELPRYLHPGALVWMEIGHRQGKELLKIFSDSQWENVVIRSDWSGNDRFFYAKFTGQDF